MEFEEYEKRIRSLPVQQLHALAERDPELAAAWAQADRARADAWAAAHGVTPDERAKEALLARLMDLIRRDDRQAQEGL